MEYPEASGGREAVPEERAGGARNFLSEAEEIAEEGGEVVVEETVVENAAVLERLEKNGATHINDNVWANIVPTRAQTRRS